jgi:regulator of protease activity HflC (stomatin/prohibitin superfamily)
MSDDELEQGHLDRYGMIFRTSRGKLVEIDEALSLRAALEKLAEAKQTARACARAETECCEGPEVYADRIAETIIAREQAEEAKANAMAAMYRETGFWPYQIYDLGLR